MADARHGTCDCAAAWREWEIQVDSNRVLAERVERLKALATKHGASSVEIWASHWEAQRG